MFILTRIAINSSLTSKRAHVCSLEMIAAYLAVPKDSSNFSYVCSVWVSKRQREGEEIVASILLSTCETNFSLQKHYFANPNNGNVRKWILKLVSKFHNDPTVVESGIVVLLEQVLGVCGKRKISVRGTFLPPQTLS